MPRMFKVWVQIPPEVAHFAMTFPISPPLSYNRDRPEQRHSCCHCTAPSYPFHLLPCSLCWNAYHYSYMPFLADYMHMHNMYMYMHVYIVLACVWWVGWLLSGTWHLLCWMWLTCCASLSDKFPAHSNFVCLRNLVGASILTHSVTHTPLL